MSTGLIASVPRPIAAIAWMPPSTQISSAPPSTIAAMVSGCGAPWFGGVQATMRDTLVLGEPADLALGEFDVGDGGRRHVGDDRIELGLREAEARRRPLVVLLRELAHGLVTALLHVLE